MTRDPRELAAAILAAAHRAQPAPPDLLDSLLDQATQPDPAVSERAAQALFRDLVEPLSDAFDPAFCDAYAEMFSLVLERLLPGFHAAELVSRYRRVRRPRRFRDGASPPGDVFVLSRVTLGADVAVTSVVLDAARKRFPKARIHFVGPAKGYELFAGDARISHVPVPYARSGSLQDRLEAGLRLRDTLNTADSIVIDPDSRLTQLGLLPVCPEDNYYFFESRSYGADGAEPLGALTRRWVGETFGVEDAMPFLAAACGPLYTGDDLVTVSFGVGDNPAKRIADPFEERLVDHLTRQGAQLLIDQGAGGEEAERVLRAIARAGAPLGQIRSWRGAFAPFAASIARSKLYIGYDSAGQHVAATCGVPLVTVFAGFTSPRMLSRWRPFGPGPAEVIPVDNPDPDTVLQRTIQSLTCLALV